jgi:hypothetical protein
MAGSFWRGVSFSSRYYSWVSRWQEGASVRGWDTSVIRELATTQVKRKHTHSSVKL